MNSYDIVLHFEWVHNSHVHKYLALNKKLNEHCKSLLIFNEGDLGITKELFSNFKTEDCANVLLMPYKQTIDLLSKMDYKKT